MIYGPLGAAIAMVLSNAVGFVWIRFSAKKLTGIHLLQSHTPRHILAGIIMGGILYYFSQFLPMIRWYHLLGFTGMGLLIYLVLLFVLREFQKKDLHFFLDLLNPKKMIFYIKNEVKNNNSDKK
jgi:peptidoglycan biosynthesis protein MviN/MurJ (putative lipid II flippase)